MNHIFADTDIILDVVTGRQPFAEEAAFIFTLTAESKIKSSTSSLSFSNLYYVLRKHATHQKVIEKLRELSELLHILNVDASIVKSALQSGFKDFEDAIQYHAALSDPDIDVIVTRNIKDYKKAELPVMTPGTFLKTYLHTS